MSTVISVENVSKLYRLGEISTGSLAHDVNRWWHRARGMEDPYLKIGQVNDRTKKAESQGTGDGKQESGPGGDSSSILSPVSRLPSSSSSDYVYALKDVSFEVKQGEVLGIIGRNGAGKSTLLKILSRVTTPTTGEIKVKGRIASLLEVGTGFHPELSGRDNIFLNGAILGMRKAEIQSKFDEIVDFSGCERYIDTPVKRYSSGMYVRLAFAVAAHLEPEILVVDEVLAVGDAEFQAKCLGKMKDVAGHGRTVLFVSHNMKSIQSLCHKALVIESGTIKYDGPTLGGLRAYSESAKMSNVTQFQAPGTRPSISSVSVDQAGLEEGNLIVDIAFQSPFPLNPPIGGLVISSLLGTPVYGTNPRFHGDNHPSVQMSDGVLRMTARNLPIHGGIYTLSVWLGDWQTDYDEKRDVLSFEFKHGDVRANTPDPEMIGFTDHHPVWSVVS